MSTERILNKINRDYPWIIKHIVDIRERTDGYYLIKMDDGEWLRYDELECKIESLYKLLHPEDMTEPQWREYFAKTLRRKLLLKNMTQVELSNKTGIGIVTINSYARAKSIPNIFSLHKLAVALDCSINDLIGFE